MKNVLIGIQAVVMEVLLIVLVFVPLLVVKGILLVLTYGLPRFPKEKPKWIDTMVIATSKFYKDYLSF